MHIEPQQTGLRKFELGYQTDVVHFDPNQFTYPYKQKQSAIESKYDP